MVFSKRRLRRLGVVFLSAFLVLTITINLFLESETVLASDLSVVLEGNGNENYRVVIQNPVAKLFDIENAQPGYNSDAEIVVVNSSNSRVSLSMSVKTANPDPNKPDLSKQGRLTINNSGASLFDDVLTNVPNGAIGGSFTVLNPAETSTLRFALDFPGEKIANEYQGTSLEFTVTIICNFLDEDPIPTPIPTPTPTFTPLYDDSTRNRVTGGYQSSVVQNSTEQLGGEQGSAGQPAISETNHDNTDGIIIEIIPDDPSLGGIKVNPNTWKAMAYSFNFMAILFLILAIIYAVYNRKNIARHLAAAKANNQNQSEVRPKN